MKSWGRAEVVVKLIDRLADDRKKEKSFINDCIEAANSNGNFKIATRFMEHECPICCKGVAVCNVGRSYFTILQFFIAFYLVKNSICKIYLFVLRYLSI